MTIRWQITQNGTQTFEGKPTTDAGEATIDLDTTTIEQLRAHKARQNTERLAAGNTWTHTGHVFTRPSGTPVDPNDVFDQFEQLTMEAGLPPIRLHDLRHAAAIVLGSRGPRRRPKAAQLSTPTTPNRGEGQAEGVNTTARAASTGDAS
ncbi:MAG TPA: hypothetical protein VFV01_41965 [Spirillospora sp.]|nr:hypothetical protein [Spirillospora sp.]